MPENPPEHPNAIALGDLGNLTDQSHEIMRVWVTNQAGSSAWIDVRLLDDPKVFGFLIADTIRHAANAYAENYGLDEGAAMRAILDGALSQLGAPDGSDTPSQPGSLN